MLFILMGVMVWQPFRKYDTLDIESETAYSSMKKLAAYIYQFPIAAINLIYKKTATTSVAQQEFDSC